MMGVGDFQHQIADRELKLARAFGTRQNNKPRAEIKRDVRRFADRQRAGAQEVWANRGEPCACINSSIAAIAPLPRATS